MTTSCNKFHKVVSGDQCNVLATKYGIALSDLMKWNPAVGSACQSLWLDYYVCVGLIGASQPNPPPSPTATQGNGIPTPEPTQPGMVGNCNRFYKVVSGDTCVVVASKAGISTTQFAAWNPQTGGAACSSLWLGYYVCTGVVGTAPSPPTPTQPGNGVATPTPIQAGMVGNCKKFHFVKPGETCAVIAANNRISTSDFIRWNPAAGSSCTGLWANTYACIGV